jgi:hypothetical protein
VFSKCWQHHFAKRIHKNREKNQRKKTETANSLNMLLRLYSCVDKKRSSYSKNASRERDQVFESILDWRVVYFGTQCLRLNLAMYTTVCDSSVADGL